ncbi:haloacid dehalogenase-like hydrolase domain-containing protein 3 [Dendronephthya gigantea]|uniref:haloacid dehalogenase-like hydrolase domain-containing protein 3 n=1 Tax=Dendronephthya gigantea TaxID=151771 RepID=UPI00106D40F6|nr:haloacid dehalogenase-like hydrolase domain-containing protein 3 [Dendronephthya gigantea]
MTYISFTALGLRNIMSQIRLITFDATNTLFKVHGGVGKVYAETAIKYGVGANPQEVDKNFKKAFKQHTIKFPNFGQSFGMSSQQWWDRVVYCSFNGEVESGILRKISSELYINFSKRSHWELFPDVFPVLDHFKIRDVKLGVISNFDERLKTILTELTIGKYFTFVLSSRETQWWKPSPEIFHHGISMVTKCSPANTLHIGDNLELDYNAARNAGMEALLLQRQPSDQELLMNKDVPKHKIITSLDQLCSLL